jgi:hypothetical protein
MKTLLSTLAILSVVTTGCRHAQPESQGTAANLGPAAVVPVAQALEITSVGTHTAPDGNWQVEVRAEDGSLHISRLRPGVASTICVGGWTAQPGWFACIESGSKVWAFDGARHLSLTVHESQNAISETLISYGPAQFPCAVPQEVIARLPEDFARTIKHQ